MVGVLLAVGTIMVYSASMTSLGDASDELFFSKHLVFLTLALLLASVTALLPARVWRILAWPLFLINVLLLLTVLLPGVGHRVNGAQRWLRLGPLSLQPSELTKLTVPLLICTLRTRSDGSLRETRIVDISVAVFSTGIALSLILIEPDLGTTLFVGMVAAIAFFLSGFPLKVFVLGGALLGPLLATLVVLRPYQLARITGFIETWVNPAVAPYQVKQSLTTLGVGGWQGTGLGKGWQKLSFLPEANTDFIFAVIGEELGLLGTMGVTLTWIGLYFTGRQFIQRHSQTTFAAVLALTLLTQLFLQAAINIGVVTAMLPPKGISHPFISYGGSSLVTSLLVIGMIFSLTKQDRPVREQESPPPLHNTSDEEPAPFETEFSQLVQ